MSDQVNIPVPPPPAEEGGASFKRKMPQKTQKSDVVDRLEEATKQKNKEPRTCIVCQACIDEGLTLAAARDHYLKGTPYPLVYATLDKTDEECAGAYHRTGGEPVMSVEQRLRYYGEGREGGSLYPRYVNTKPWAGPDFDSSRERITKDTEGL